MLGKTRLNIPYYCEQPLSAETEWVAIPIHVSCKAREFRSAANSARDVLQNTMSCVSGLDSPKCQISLLEFDQEFEDLKAVIELVNVNDSESQTNIYNFMILKFDAASDFWTKVESLSEILDALYHYAQKCKSDKSIHISYGQRYEYGKSVSI